MTTLVVGATGATGRLLVAELLGRGAAVRAVVRSPDKLSEAVRAHPALEVVEANLLDLSDAQMADLVRGCTAVASCLGHNLTLKGIFGPPRRLVTDATRRLSQAVKTLHPAAPVKYVLMNTAGNRNRDLDESVSTAEKALLVLLRAILPPQADNEAAADYLRVAIGQADPAVEWTAVRPDGLTNETAVTPYDVHPSPIRSAVFNPGKTSRINVAHFMADLILDETLWQQWRGRMPVIYNAASP